MVILLLASAGLAIALARHYKGDMDFRMFYSAAQMVRHGAGTQLYDVSAQHEFQARFTNYPGLIFNYPPATAALYLPTTVASLRTGFVIWTILNVIALLISVRLLQPRRGILADSYYFPVFALAFGPTLFTLLQGQVSAVVLTLYCAALYSLRRAAMVFAGASLGLTLIKPQLGVPILAVIILQRRWKLLSGYLLGAATLVALSVAVAGWRTLIAYPSFLRHMADMPLTGINPRMMATVRALYFYVRGNEPPILLMVVISVLLLILAARFSIETELGFAITIAITLLVAYHLNPHDLLLLAVPLTVLVTGTENASSVRAFVLLVLWATPLQIVLWAPQHFPLVALELLFVLGLLIRLQRATDRRNQSALHNRQAVATSA